MATFLLKYRSCHCKEMIRFAMVKRKQINAIWQRFALVKNRYE